MKPKKIRIALTLSAVLLVLLTGVFEGYSRIPGKRQANKQVVRFVKALDYNRPEKIYPLLTMELRDLIDRDIFIKNFIHERSYPYLTPLFVYVDSITFDDELKTGHVICTVASRLPGEFMDFNVVYSPGKGYFIDALHPIVDGSYLKLFDRL